MRYHVEEQLQTGTWVRIPGSHGGHHFVSGFYLMWPAPGVRMVREDGFVIAIRHKVP